MWIPTALMVACWAAAFIGVVTATLALANLTWFRRGMTEGQIRLFTRILKWSVLVFLLSVGSILLLGIVFIRR